MTEAVLFTIALFVLAVALCITLNYALFESGWIGGPAWARQICFIGCVAAIFSALYVVVGRMWGALV